ncbi:hypothetical protein B0H63DRAFT_468154 [Podospora didyma]|uniref:Secreted protein n=1 Tax=Podospora didyma TaxID=330526 RepID=A0AAE0NSC2_9PEZI|nr:hypothetical protein B0H63DRAFT_468154 [Podospora didyma]
MACAAAIVQPEPRQDGTPFVKVVSARNLGGNGCPDGKFGTSLNPDNNTIVLDFGAYNTFIGLSNPGDTRERFCDYAVTFQYPVGCTTGIILTDIWGTVKLSKGHVGTFHAEYTASPGDVGQPAAQNLDFTNADYGINKGVDFRRIQEVTVTERIQNENERNVEFTARTRLFLTAPGPEEGSDFSLDSIHISARDQRVC